MSEENNGEGTAPAAPVFDANAFKNEILENNQRLIDTAVSTLASTIDSRLSGFETTRAPQKVEAEDDLNEYASFTDEIGVDKNQLNGIVKLVSKVLQQQSPNIENSLLKKVDSTLDARETKQAYTTQTAKMFPEILDKNSALFKTTVQIYNQMSPEARSAPDAEQIATERAALRLGKSPITMESIRAQSAHSESGSGAGGEAKKAKQDMSEEFASFFNVDYKKANAHYQQGLQKRTRQ